MSEGRQQEGRAERMARYKEERKRQLAARFGTRETGADLPSPRRPKEGTTSSSSEGPRPTRTSRLRAQAASQQDENSSHNQESRLTHSERTAANQCPANGGSGETPRGTAASRRNERDKSAKRKSYLNRSQNSEEVPSDFSDETGRRRRRRNQQLADTNNRQTPVDCKPTGESSTTAETSHITTAPSITTAVAQTNTASSTGAPSPSPTAASGSGLGRASPRRSELSMHMENARRGVTTSYSEMGKYRPYAKRFGASPKEKHTVSDHDVGPSDYNGYSRTSSNRESITKKKIEEPEDRRRTRSIMKRMEELSAKTKKTLANVELLTNKAKESPRKELPPTEDKTSVKYLEKTSFERCAPFSILRHKSEEPSAPVEPSPAPPRVTTSQPAGPVSILKRKVPQDEHNKNDSTSTTQTPPVTFSPSVVEPTPTNRRQGILKKRRSLDESQVMRHRSCSPDIANKSDSRGSILKHRRSSLEELTRCDSPDTHIQGILKRKTSRHEEEDQSLNSPQSILKRRSGTSSANSTSSTPHVSITTAVILAAAGGAEMVLESENNEPVRPILKKKSFSEDHHHNTDHSSSFDAPKPILKKKSSTDTDEACDDKPKPILKLRKSSTDRETCDGANKDRPSIRHVSSTETDCDISQIKPILKQNSRDETSRNRLSFSGGDSRNEEVLMRQRGGRRSNTICCEFQPNANKNELNKDEDRHLKKPRPLSVFELVMSFEKSSQGTSTGAIPKRSSLKRTSERYRTQPVTSDELEESLNLVKEDHHTLGSSSRSFEEPGCSTPPQSTLHSLLEFTTSLERDIHLKGLLSSPTNEEGGAKMSSDSAFQSLGDGLELEETDEEQKEVEKSAELTKSKAKSDQNKLELQMKSIAEEAKNMRLGRGNAGVDRYRLRSSGKTSNRFSTQPVTFQEVQDAANFNQDGTTGEGGDTKSPSRRKAVTSPTDIRRQSQRSETVDEGISCNDSASDSEASPPSPVSHSRKNASGKFADSTSEGESSGGREVRSIFKGDNKLQIKLQLEQVLSKSRSHGVVRDDSSLPVNQGTGAAVKPSSLRRSQTHSAAAMPQSIADLRAKLQESGETEWRKRIPLNNNVNDELKLLKDKNRYNDEKSLLASKKDELDASSKQWTERVEKSDAEKFSVAGRMKNAKDVPLINIEKTSRTPQARRFKGVKDSTSPEKYGNFDLSRSKSMPAPPKDAGLLASKDPSKIVRVVSVIQPDDYTFQSFFESVDKKKYKDEQVDISKEDFDAIERQSLLVLKKNVTVHKRRGTSSKNPLKALANRTDISSEYTEVITDKAEREKKRLIFDKMAKGSNLAIEALAGLASNEDFKSVALKKPQSLSVLVPFKDVMLLQVKGRRHVQTRLVEPVVNSINEGDCYILITRSALYNYVGRYSNIIEQSRAADIANHIKQTNDMGCKVGEVITLNQKEGQQRHLQAFWKILGASETPEIVDAGHPDEDETYESNISNTNMIYTFEKDELVPLDKYWGAIPKIEILDDSKVLVFDFGSEMYVWSGKTAPLESKRAALNCAKEMWSKGYNYSECAICPLNVASILGDRKQEKLSLKDDQRPNWALFCKLTQHRETILFREKFLDWPDFSRVITVKTDDTIKSVSTSFDIKPYNVEEMLKNKGNNPDLVIQDTHLGRGENYFDEESSRLFEFETEEIKAWKIQENSHDKLDEKSFGHFYEGDSYIYSWRFRMTVRGRGLTGNPSKHKQVGKEKCVFFYWQGSKSSVNEKCAAAFLTVELDKENAPHVRITQGSEPAVFLRLFKGEMIIHKGKRGEPIDKTTPRMFAVRGELENEIHFLEVPLEMKCLRSQTSFIVLDTEDEEQVTIWHGSKSNENRRNAANASVRKMMNKKPRELNLHLFEEDLDIVELEEFSEDDNLLKLLGSDRSSYFSLKDKKNDYDFTMRMFHMTSLTGDFVAKEILCPFRSDKPTAYPFQQSELYSASQPALFLIDNKHELWLWQGWWPEKTDEDDSGSDQASSTGSSEQQTGSGVVRWQAERRAAMQTAINYWRKKNGGDEADVPAYLVSAGLEPLEFQNLFPTWDCMEDVAERNKKEGKVDGEKLSLVEKLAQLSRSTYSIDELLQRPLPEGVDPTHLEMYLSAEDFQSLLQMSKEEFEKLPSWKQSTIKKEKGLF